MNDTHPPCPLIGTPAALTDSQKQQIRDAIAAATSPEEMDRIERQLRVRKLAVM